MVIAGQRSIASTSTMLSMAAASPHSRLSVWPMLVVLCCWRDPLRAEMGLWHFHSCCGSPSALAQLPFILSKPPSISLWREEWQVIFLTSLLAFGACTIPWLVLGGSAPPWQELQKHTQSSLWKAEYNQSETVLIGVLCDTEIHYCCSFR